VKFRPVLPALLAALLALVLVAGCGGGDDESGAGEAAAVAPPKAPLFMSFVVRPEGKTKTNIEALAEEVAGVEDVGSLIVEELEKSAEEDGEAFDYEKEVEPWLGERGGFFAKEYADGDFTGYGVAVETEDEDAAWAFVEKQTAGEDEPAADGSYEGVDFKITADEGQAIGVFDGLIAFGEDEAIFKQMVDASEGESLSKAEAYTNAISSLPDGSAGDLYVDIGAIIRGSGEEVDPEAKSYLESAGINPEEATAVASVIPGSDNVEIDLTTNATGDQAPAGDATEMLESLPATSVAALAGADFGKRLQEGIDQLDAQGIPSEGIEPNELKKSLKEGGIDIEQIASSLGDVGIFATGNSQSTLSGAVVFTSEGDRTAKNTVANLGLLLRASDTPGVTALSGKFSGFSIRDPELGPQPLVVAAAEDRLAIAYGMRAATAALQPSGKTLSDNAAFEQAVAALGGTPVSGFVDGPAAVRLADALVPAEEREGFEEAKQFRDKIQYVAIGSDSEGDLATAKLIVGVGK
jgi:Protein of unknown function (DUF3352)